ncbi:hypothetical protein ACOAPY_01835 [Pseudomonas sp. P3C3]
MAKRTSSTQGKGSSGKKKSRLELKVRNDGRQSGVSVVCFDFLVDWLGDDAGLFLNGIARFSRRYSSAASTYAVRRVLEHWAGMHKTRDWSNPKDSAAEDFKVMLSEIRESFYIEETAKGLALTTTTNKWTAFVNLLEELSAVGAIPMVFIGAYVKAPRGSEILTVRQSAVDGVEVVSLPKSFRPDKDSFNDDLLEPISLTASDEKYLIEYTTKLNCALAAIRSCAIADFNLLKSKQAEGAALIEKTGCGYQIDMRENPWPVRYYDFSVRKHYFEAEGGHPNLLGNLLSVVHHEMGGIPKPHRKFKSNIKNAVSCSGNSHWQYVAKYGKNKLIPYLGLMSSEAAAVCMLLLMLEHPKFNSTSLYRAKVEDKNGFSVLLSSADGDNVRLTVKKPRAGEEKSEVLSDLAKDVITKVMEWTSPIRQEMRRQGREEEASNLWLGISSLNYDLKAFSEKALVGGLYVNPAWRKRGKEEVNTRVYSFVDRHAELMPWKDKINFKAIRVNAGVAAYLNSDGDLVASAKAFGHKNIKTTINNYIPLALQRAVFERQIRRHQNFLITSAMREESEMLRVSDFRTIEQLHEYLKSSSSYLFDSELEVQARESEKPVVDSAVLSRLVLANDPEALAVAMLYRDSLDKATPSFINRPDSLTGVAPKFWMEFIDAVVVPLPLALSDLSKLVQKALARKATISSMIILPEIG